MQVLIAFNKKGDKAAQVEIPELPYLQTQKEWIHNTLDRRPELDGLALIINWQSQEITVAKHAE